MKARPEGARWKRSKQFDINSEFGEVRVKSSSFVSLVILLALVLLAGCNKSGDPAAPSDASNANAASSTPEGGEKGGEKEKKAARETITIPAGTAIVVRLGDSLSSKTSQAGEGFSGTVAEAVAVDGKTVIKKGAAARGTVVDAQAMGHFKGGALLHVTLNSVEIEGNERKIQTSTAGSTLKGKGKRSAVAIGGGAGVGAVLGGIFGGGKGAAIGAAAGAGAGTAGAAYTGNKEIVFPAETALTFKLKQPVEVR